jgi:hypothetical protein
MQKPAQSYQRGLVVPHSCLPLDSCTPSAEETCVKPHLALAVAIHQMMVEQTEAVGGRAPTATLPPALHLKTHE